MGPLLLWLLCSPLCGFVRAISFFLVLRVLLCFSLFFPRPTSTPHLHSLRFSVIPSTESIHLYVLKDLLTSHSLTILPLSFSFNFLLCSLPSLFVIPLLLATGSFLWQQWDKGGGAPEEPEWFIADTRLATGPQPPVLAAPVGPEPQPAAGLDVPQCGRLPGQAALQLRLPADPGTACAVLTCWAMTPRGSTPSIKDRLCPRRCITNILFPKLLHFHPQPLNLKIGSGVEFNSNMIRTKCIYSLFIGC